MSYWVWAPLLPGGAQVLTTIVSKGVTDTIALPETDTGSLVLPIDFRAVDSAVLGFFEPPYQSTLSWQLHDEPSVILSEASPSDPRSPAVTDSCAIQASE